MIMRSHRLARWAVGLFLALLTTTGVAEVGLAATPAPPSSLCGNGLLDAGESCDACPADCASATCEPSGTRQRVTIELTPQQGFDKVGAVSVLLAFRPTALTIPGERNEPAVSARVKARTPDTQLFINDLGYGLRVGASNNDGMPAGPLVDVELDTCAGALAAQASDVGCRVESCAFGGGRLRDCACAATLH